eukprot:SAG22_NODE_290_length_12941_cov_3.715465_1_plen_2481_part_10
MCPAGRFLAQSGAFLTENQTVPDVCEACPVGTYASEGSAICEMCKGWAPTVWDHDGDPSTPCETCPYGTMRMPCADDLAGIAAAHGETCETGILGMRMTPENCQKQSPSPSDSPWAADHTLSELCMVTCGKCSPPVTPAEFQADNQCRLCPAGTFAPAVGSCITCAAGQFDHDQNVTTACQPCPAGTFMDMGGSVSCTSCPAGMSSEAGSISCSCSTDALPVLEPYENYYQAGCSAATCAAGTQHWSITPWPTKLSTLVDLYAESWAMKSPPTSRKVCGELCLAWSDIELTGNRDVNNRNAGWCRSGNKAQDFPYVGQQYCGGYFLGLSSVEPNSRGKDGGAYCFPGSNFPDTSEVPFALQDFGTYSGYAQARAMCTAAGARMCTDLEHKMDKIETDQCGFDLHTQPAWTSEACSSQICGVGAVTTAEGTAPAGTPCSFPFFVNGVEYNECAVIPLFPSGTGPLCLTGQTNLGPPRGRFYFLEGLQAGADASVAPLWGHCNCAAALSVTTYQGHLANFLPGLSQDKQPMIIANSMCPLECNPRSCPTGCNPKCIPDDSSVPAVACCADIIRPADLCAALVPCAGEDGGTIGVSQACFDSMSSPVRHIPDDENGQIPGNAIPEIYGECNNGECEAATVSAETVAAIVARHNDCVANPPSDDFHKEMIPTCVACPAGHADLDSNPSTACQLCPSSTYAEAGGVSCTPCPRGTTSPSGSSTVVDCVAAPRYVGCYTDVETWTDLPDLPVRRQMGTGMTCSTLVGVFGCAVDMHDVISAAPAGSLVSTLCPLSCSSCPQVAAAVECADDHNGILPFPCPDAVAQVPGGCSQDMHEIDDDIAAGTLLSSLCPVTCDACPEPPVCSDDPDGLVSATAPASHQTCQALCQGFAYMGLQAAEMCSCGNSYGKYVCPDVEPIPPCEDDPDSRLPMACPGVLQQGLTCDTDLSSIDSQFTETIMVSSLCPVTCGVCTPCADDPDGVLPTSCAEAAAGVPGGCGQDLHEVNDMFEEGLILSAVCPETCGDCEVDPAVDGCRDPDRQCGDAGAACGNGVSDFQCFEGVTVMIRLPLALNRDGNTATDAVETSWNIDGGKTFQHHETDGGRVIETEIATSSARSHVFNFFDHDSGLVEGVQGWRGGWWAIKDKCGNVIGGGPDQGKVEFTWSQTSSSFSWSGPDQCCGGCKGTNAIFELPVRSCSDDVQCDAGEVTRGAALATCTAADPAVDCATGFNASTATGCPASCTLTAAVASAVGLSEADAKDTCCERSCTTWGATNVCSSGSLLDAASAEVTPVGADGAETCCVAAGSCPAGSVLSGSTCTPCPAGLYDHDSSSSSACEPCLAGSFSREGATSCAACEAGMYDDDGLASTACIMCSAGTFASAESSTFCESCSNGDVSVPGSAACAPPAQVFAESACPAEWGACAAAAGCSDSFRAAMASPERPLAGELALLELIRCVSRSPSPRQGCTDSSAANYDAAAAFNNGGCKYECSQLLTRHGLQADASCHILASMQEFDGTVRNKSHIIVQGPAAQSPFGVSTDCHFTLNTDALSWAEAEQKCELGGGHLASAHTSEQQQKLVHASQGASVWIGLNDRTNEAGCDRDAFVWSDGSSPTLTSWDAGQPDSMGCYIRYDEGTDCLHQFEGVAFEDRDCADLQLHSDEDPVNRVGYLDTQVCELDSRSYFCGYPCDDDPSVFSCSIVFVPGKYLFSQAEENCAAAGGHLPSIHSAEQMASLFAQFPEQKGWIGLNDLDYEMGCDGTGATEGGFVDQRGRARAVCDPPTAYCTRDGAPGWKWIDGSATDFLPWRSTDQPMSKSKTIPEEVCKSDCVGQCLAGNSKEDCVLANDGGQAWNDQDCSVEMSYACGFACPPPNGGASSSAVSLSSQTLICRHLDFTALSAHGQGGSAHGAAVAATRSTLDVAYSSFADNIQRGVGAGALYVGDSSTAKISFSSFVRNRNIGRGAAGVYSKSSTVSMEYTRFDSNQAVDLGGIDRSDLAAGAGVGRSAAIVAEASHVAVDSCQFANNKGSVIAALASSILNVVGSIFTGNYAYAGDGVSSPHTTSGAISVRAGSVATFSSILFSSNVGTTSGAILIDGTGSGASFDRSRFIRNRASSSDTIDIRGAGAILVLGQGSLSVSNGSVFDGNTAALTRSAGAIMVFESPSVVVSDTRLVDNTVDVRTATSGAGCIFVESSHFSLVRSLLSANVASGEDGTLIGSESADQLFAKNPEQAYVLDTNFVPFVDGRTALIIPGAVNGRLRGGCSEHPCDAGHSCAYIEYALSCTPCPEELYSTDGITCIQCPQGSGPAPGGRSCTGCSGNNHSSFGVCLECPTGLIVSDDRTSCEDCGTRLTAVTKPGSTRRTCGCADGLYNASAKVHVCFANGFDRDQRDTVMAKAQALIGTGQSCEESPVDVTGASCLTSQGGDSLVSPGFMIPRMPGAGRRRLAEQPDSGDGGEVSVFRCHIEMELAIERCPGEAVMGSVDECAP